MKNTNIITADKNGQYDMEGIIQCLDEVGFKLKPIVKNGTLYCTKSEETFNPDEVSIVGSYRFEALSDPDDISILYAIQANNGARAILINSYGVYADPDVADFINQVKDERSNSHLMENIPPRKTILISVN